MNQINFGELWKWYLQIHCDMKYTSIDRRSGCLCNGRTKNTQQYQQQQGNVYIERDFKVRVCAMEGINKKLSIFDHCYQVVFRLQCEVEKVESIAYIHGIEYWIEYEIDYYN